MVICERNAALVATAHLPFRFVELESFKNFTQAFIDLGAAYGCVPDLDFIAGNMSLDLRKSSFHAHNSKTHSSPLHDIALYIG